MNIIFKTIDAFFEELNSGIVYMGHLIDFALIRPEWVFFFIMLLIVGSFELITLYLRLRKVGITTQRERTRKTKFRTSRSGFNQLKRVKMS